MKRPTRNRVLFSALALDRTYSSMTEMNLSSRRSFLAQLSAVALATQTRAWASQPTLFAGTYTNDKGSTSQGIYAFLWDADAGSLSPLGLVAATVNPSFLTFSPSRRHLYAVNEVDQYQGEKKAGR